MLDETLVICTTEFGRQPASQGGKGLGGIITPELLPHGWLVGASREAYATVQRMN